MTKKILKFTIPIVLIISVALIVGFKKVNEIKRNRTRGNIESISIIVKSDYLFKSNNGATLVFGSDLESLKILGSQVEEPVWSYDKSYNGDVKFIKDEHGTVARRSYVPPKELVNLDSDSIERHLSGDSYYSLSFQSKSGDFLDIILFPIRKIETNGLAVVRTRAR